MSTDLLTQMVFSLTGGLGIFLFGMKSMSDGMKAVGGRKLRKIIGSVTERRLMAVGAGVLATFLVQSSSITTVLVVGFVSSGIMTLVQAIGVILGANIGTTITGWILALKVGKYGLPLLGIGVFVLIFSKRERVRLWAMVVMGLGMIFFGLELMKSGFKPMRDMPEFVAWFSHFAADSYWGVIRAALLGCLLTVIVQSSSATLGITMGLAGTGVIDFQTAAAFVLGENIGTTVTAFLASLGAPTIARRAAFSHILFNVIGVTWIIAIFFPYIAFIDQLALWSAHLFGVTPTVLVKIALVHTAFNVINTLLFIPLIPVLARLVTLLVPVKADVGGTLETKFINEHCLSTPEIALDLIEQEQIHLMKQLPAYLDTLRGGSAKTLNLAAAHQGFSAVLKEVEEFSAELVDRKLSTETSQRALNIFHRRELIGSIEEALFQFVEGIRNATASSTMQPHVSSFIEGLDMILLMAIDALESKDESDIHDLAVVTSDKGEVLERVRINYLSSTSVFEFQDKSLLLTMVNLFERIVWMLRKLALLEIENRSEGAEIDHAA